METQYEGRKEIWRNFNSSLFCLIVAISVLKVLKHLKQRKTFAWSGGKTLTELQLIQRSMKIENMIFKKCLTFPSSILTPFFKSLGNKH